MDINEKLLDVYTNFIDYDNSNEYFIDFVNFIEKAMEKIKNNLKLDFKYEIKLFGSTNFCTLATQYEPLTIAINLYDMQIFNNVLICKNSKIKNKKSHYITTDAVKVLLAILVENYLNENGNVSVYRNCLSLNSMNYLGFNARLYIFACSYDKSIMLDSYSNKLLEANIEEGENAFLEKANETNNNVLRICNIIKNFANKGNVLQEPLLIESLCFNVPNKYYYGSLKEQFVKIINYIKCANISKFKVLTNLKNEFVNDNFLISSIYTIYKEIDTLIKMLV